jgi:hypothetical protein
LILTKFHVLSRCFILISAISDCPVEINDKYY